MDPLVWPLAEELLDCLRFGFLDFDHPAPPELICHRIGTGSAVAQFDPKSGKNECCKGLAWVRPTPFGPTLGGESLEFNRSASMGATNCFGQWAVSFELGALRCWPHAGGYATCDDWATVAYNVYEDAAALRRAIRCCWIPAHEDEGTLTTIVGVWNPAGIQGQCVGGSMSVTIGVGDRCRFDTCETTSPTSPTSP